MRDLRISRSLGLVILFIALILYSIFKSDTLISKDYKDTSNGFSIEIPSSFKVLPAHKVFILLTMIPKGDDETHFYVKKLVNNDSFENFIQTYLKNSSQNHNENYKTVKTLEKGYTNHNKTKTYYVAYELISKDNKKLYMKQYLIPSDGNVFNLELLTPFNHKDDYEALLNRMKVSFNLI